jgi:hypothetical protein
MIDESYE